METQRTLLWIVFGMCLILLWDRWQAYQGHGSLLGLAPAASTAVPRTEAPAAGTAAPASPQASAATAAALAGGAQGAAAPAPAELIHVETDVLRLDFDPQGAVLVRAELLQQHEGVNWKAEGIAGFINNQPHLVPHNEVLFELGPSRSYFAQSGLVLDRDLGGLPHPRPSTRYELEAGPRTLAAGQDQLTLRFVATAGDARLAKTFTLRRGQYGIGVGHRVDNTGQAPLSLSLYLELVRDNGKTAEESSFYRTYTGTAMYTDAEKFHKVSFEDIDKQKGQPVALGSSTDGWVGMIQHYFLSAWVPEKGVERQLYTRSIDGRLYATGALLPLGTVAPGASATREATLYVGPQDQTTLEALAPGLDRVADYGWLDPIAKPIFWLLGYLYKLVGNWGWAIVLLTILIKAAFYPLSAAGYRSMAKMKDVAPRLAKLKEQYGEDKQKMQLAMMEIYKQEKINPLGGCLPILVQIPVFIALYWVLLGSVEMRNAPWVLWIKDLSAPDPWFVLPAVLMATSWIQFKLQPTPPDPVQAKMMAVMPFVFGVMFFFFPSGLVLYYLLNNGLSILQQQRINQVIARAKRVG